jgi:hypothetical protein
MTITMTMRMRRMEIEKKRKVWKEMRTRERNKED